MSLTVSMVKRDMGVVVVTPVGSIDTSTSDILEAHVDEILPSAPQVLVFDMTGVSYISSAGLRVIIKSKQVLARTGGKVMLVHLQARVKKVFEIIKALPPEAVFASVEEMDAYLDKIQQKI